MPVSSTVSLDASAVAWVTVAWADAAALATFAAWASVRIF